MKLLHIIVVAALASSASASSWFSKSGESYHVPFCIRMLATKAEEWIAYNKWHKNELERWLSDHDIPYSTPEDHKELEKIVKEYWQAKAVRPYQEWDSPQLQSYLGGKGQELNRMGKEDKDWLIESVRKSWYETDSAAEESYNSIKDWIFDRYDFPYVHRQCSE